MSMANTLAALARQSMTEPRPAAANLMALGIPREALWPAFVLVNIVSVVLAALMFGPQEVPPFRTAAVSLVSSVLSIMLVLKLGQLMGGKGTFEDTLLLTTFLQAIFLVGQVIQVFISFIFLPLAGLYFFALLIFVIWLNINFIAALHGFTSLWRAFGTLMLASFALAMLFMFYLGLTGQLPEPPQ